MIKAVCDLHVHSCLSPCAEDDMTPCNIAGMAYLNGLNLVALTDHNTSRNCPAFFRACAEYGITPIAGMELTTAEDIHLVCLFDSLKDAEGFEEIVRPRRMRVKNRPDIFGNQSVMDENDVVVDVDEYFLPAATDISLEEAVQLVRDLGGVCQPAHIDREANGLLAVLGAFPDYPEFPAVELNDGSRTELAAGRRIVVSSDAHRLWELSDGEFSLDLDDKDGTISLRRALFNYLGGLQ